MLMMLYYKISGLVNTFQCISHLPSSRIGACEGVDASVGEWREGMGTPKEEDKVLMAAWIRGHRKLLPP